MANSVACADDDAAEDCKSQVEMMLKHNIAETAIQPALMAKVRALMSRPL